MYQYKSPYKTSDVRPGRGKPKPKKIKAMALPGNKDLLRMHKKGRRGYNKRGERI